MQISSATSTPLVCRLCRSVPAKLVINGDVGDQFNLGGNAIHGMAEGSLVGGRTAPNGTAEIAYFPGNPTGYLKLTNGAIDIYIHEDVANLT